MANHGVDVRELNDYFQDVVPECLEIRGKDTEKDSEIKKVNVVKKPVMRRSTDRKNIKTDKAVDDQVDETFNLGHEDVKPIPEMYSIKKGSVPPSGRKNTGNIVHDDPKKRGVIFVRCNKSPEIEERVVDELIQAADDRDIMIQEFIVNEKIETKESMNCSFIKDNFNGDNSYSLFCNNNKGNYNKQVFNFETNDNFLDNFNITRSKTIRFGERPKFSILNCQTESTSSQLFRNSINVFSRMSSISSINSINSNASNINNYEIQKVSTFKDKPKLGSLPLMCSNSIKTKNEHNTYGFFRSKTMKIDNTNNSKKNNKDEINKWLMRI